MQYQIIHRDRCPTSHWSGGSTTELFLWPEHARYAERDFSVRVSTATVEVDASDFTPLPGFTRLLMTVSGAMELCIAGQGVVPLPTWASARFDGGAPTVSRGRCVDFGVMLGAGWDGELYAAHSGTYRCESGGFTGVYCPASPAKVFLQGSSAPPVRVYLNRGDLLLVQGHGEVRTESVENQIVFILSEQQQ